MVRIIEPLLSEIEKEVLLRVLEYLAGVEKEYAKLSSEERPGHIFRVALVLRSCEQLGYERLELGELCITPNAADAIERSKQEPWEFLSRHSVGDWGDVCFDDWQENNASLKTGLRIFSSYETNSGERLWIITEADRSLTTFVLPDDY
jgi:hypothetical protein